MESLFEQFPDDIKEKVYSTIMYPQPKELLKEIRQRGIIYSILSTLNREKELKPTLTNLAVAISDMPRKERNYIFKVMEDSIKTGV
jgi:aromatic ring hydroxylase